ncbi:MAG: site-specific integrase [Bacteroidetes bacterium]|nr:site-specific integrase [Bacteroidota bacterium]
MRESFNTKIILRKDFVRKDGTAGLYIRLTWNRKVKYVFLNRFVPVAAWDYEKERPKPNCPNYSLVCAFVQKMRNKADESLLKLQLENKQITFTSFLRIFSESREDVCFYAFSRKEIELMKGKVAECTIRNYNAELTKLDRFRKEMTLRDFTYDFLEQYEHYMINVLKNRTNTVHNSMKRIKKMLNVAVRKDLIPANPFNNFKLRKEKTERNFLTLEELKKLENLMLQNINEKIRNVEQYFLFCCYTGIRYHDVKNLTWQNIRDGYISVKINKTGEPVTIPLTGPASRHLHADTCINGAPVFRVLTNQKTNDYLKLAMILAGIEKTISFHCARHTFATNSLTLGLSIEVVSKVLGHQDIKTTQIYAKIVDELKFREMQKWNCIGV